MNTVNEVGTRLYVAHLPMPERLFLWAMRAWSEYCADPSAVWHSLRQVFADAGIRAVLEPFDQMMFTLFVSLQQPPVIHCVRCPRLGIDEVRLLSVFSHLQQHNRIAAQLVLQTWVPRVAAKAICECAHDCVRITAIAGLHFELQQHEPQAPQPSSRTASPDFVPALIH